VEKGICFSFISPDRAAKYDEQIRRQRINAAKVIDPDVAVADIVLVAA
jgi:hypothetical protein